MKKLFKVFVLLIAVTAMGIINVPTGEAASPGGGDSYCPDWDQTTAYCAYDDMWPGCIMQNVDCLPACYYGC